MVTGRAKQTKNVKAARHSSMVSYAPTILQPQVRIPSRPATRFSTYNVKIETVFDDEIAKRTKIKHKRPELAHI